MRALPIQRGMFFFASLVIVLMIAVQWMFFVQQKEHAHVAHEWVQHTDKVLDTFEDMFGKLRDSELGQRGYVITGREDVLNPHRAAIGQPITSSAPASMGNYDALNIFELRHILHKMLSDNPVQTERLERMERLIDEKLAQTETLILTRREQGEAAAIAQAKIYQQSYLMKRIRIILADIVSTEEQLYKERTLRDDVIDAKLNDFIVLSAIAAYGALGVMLLLIVLSGRRARLAERRLLLKENHFRAVAESGIDAFFLFRAVGSTEGKATDLVLAYANPVAASGLMMNAQRMIGMSIDTILPQDHGGETTQAYLDIFHNQVAAQNEYSILQGPWAGRFFQRQMIPLADGIALLCRDITEQKKMERMKNEFVSTVSHELRTPLTSIRGSLGLILGGIAGPVAEQARGLLSIAHSNCERLVRLINDILDIEKIEAGNMNFHCRPLALGGFLQQARETNEAYAAKFSVTLALEMGGMEQAQIHADPDRLMQIMTNLLSNAAKFSPPGGIVTLRCLREGGRARIEVEDHGTGIPQPYHAGIFDRFVQVDGSDTRQKGGTGLGLSIVKSMTERMEGMVDFESSEGKGSRFWVSFPLLAAPERSLPLEDDKRPRILICEDERDVAQLLSIVLGRAGFASDIATDAAEAMHYLHGQSYAAMTLDLLLPDRYGMELLAALRTNPHFSNLPIVVISARAEQAQQESTGTEVLDWISKPIDTERLVSHMRALVAGKTRPCILHIEDDAGLAEIMRMALPEADVLHAASLAEARHIIGRHSGSGRFDLVVLDVGLPDGLGTELLPLIRHHAGDVPIMLFTAADVAPGVSAAVNASLVKSRTSDQALIDTIRTLIGQGTPSYQTPFPSTPIREPRESLS